MAAREAAGFVIGEEAFGRRPKHRDPFGIYRRLIAPKRKFLAVDLTVSLAYPDKKYRDFRSLEVPETIEWE